MTGDVNTTSTNTNKFSGIIENSQKNIKSVVSKSGLLNRQVQNLSGNCGGSYTVNISQQLSSSENASVFTAELDGKIYLGEYGSLTFETTVPFKVSQSATNPTQGSILIKGNNLRLN